MDMKPMLGISHYFSTAVLYAATIVVMPYDDE